MKIYRLSKETSPYSKQHAENAVGCFSWSKEALDKARLEFKRILLSIGYKVLHWYHVMPHKSFGVDERTEIMNKYSINIKVGGEEKSDLDKIYQFGPYGPMHATAGTFAFKRELLKQTKYDDNAEMAEEKKFLKDYTVPLAQLDPRKSILCFAHQFNTFDKRKLLINANPNYVRETKLKPSAFIKDKELLLFYASI